MNEHELLEQHAIDAAMNLAWKDAVAFNKQILKGDKLNLSAFLRLGFAYLQMNNLSDALKTYQKVLKIQSENQIALDNIERIKILDQKGQKNEIRRAQKFDPNLFLEVPGKTKSSTLVNLGQKNILAKLTIGDEIIIKSKKRKAEIRTTENEYLGSLPDDLSKRLYLFIKGESEYSCYIKEVSLNKVIVFIKELKKGKKLQRYSSFPKNIQSNMARVNETDDPTKDHHEDGEDEIDHLSESEIDRLAESLVNEDKDYFFIERTEEEEENLEE